MRYAAVNSSRCAAVHGRRAGDSGSRHRTGRRVEHRRHLGRAGQRCVDTGIGVGPSAGSIADSPHGPRPVRRSPPSRCADGDRAGLDARSGHRRLRPAPQRPAATAATTPPAAAPPATRRTGRARRSRPRRNLPPHPPMSRSSRPYATVIGWHGDAQVAYLTFDDGPGPATGRVLDILAAQRRARRRSARSGSGSPRPRTSPAGWWPRGTPCATTPGTTTRPSTRCRPPTSTGRSGGPRTRSSRPSAATARYFRAPEGAFGATGGTVLQAAQRARTIPLGWGVDSLDWRKPGVDAIVANVLDGGLSRRGDPAA